MLKVADGAVSGDQEDITKEVRAAFSKELNRHGYGFQYAVLDKCQEVAERLQKESAAATWLPLVSEFPVAIQGAGTKADFILERIGRITGRKVPCFLIAECKRANPALSDWCFAQAPYVHQARPLGYEPVVVERFSVNGQSVGIENAYSAQRPYHIGIEVRTRKKGDAEGESGQAIEKAASQVLRALNGFVFTLAQNFQLLGGEINAHILPVVFTTANLWISEVSLSDSDLLTGSSGVNEKDFKSLDWLCYQYHMSPGIKHSLSPVTKPSDLGALMQSEYIRTVPIVNASGIEPFFDWISGIRFD